LSFAFSHFCDNASLFFFFTMSDTFFLCIPSAHAGNQVHAASRTC